MAGPAVATHESSAPPIPSVAHGHYYEGNRKTHQTVGEMLRIQGLMSANSTNIHSDTPVKQPIASEPVAAEPSVVASAQKPLAKQNSKIGMNMNHGIKPPSPNTSNMG